MPPRRYSRHTFVQQISRDGVVFLTDRVKFRYADFPDNIIHLVKEGDTLHRLAARVYAPLSDPPRFSAAQLWWVIADFQPQPIHDPTIQLTGTLVIPSLRVLQDRILNAAYRRRAGL